MLINNTILWYMYNRMDGMRHHILTKVVLDFYSELDIEKAKDCFFQHLPHQRNVKRRGDNKSEMNIKDILESMHTLQNKQTASPETDDDGPDLIFVTASTKFPSLDIMDIDAGCLAEDVKSLKQDVKSLRQIQENKAKLSAQIAEVRSMVSELTAMTKKKDTSISKSKVNDSSFLPSVINWSWVVIKVMQK